MLTITWGVTCAILSIAFVMSLTVCLLGIAIFVDSCDIHVRQHSGCTPSDSTVSKECGNGCENCMEAELEIVYPRITDRDFPLVGTLVFLAGLFTGASDVYVAWVILM